MFQEPTSISLMLTSLVQHLSNVKNPSQQLDVLLPQQFWNEKDSIPRLQQISVPFRIGETGSLVIRKSANPS